MCCLPTALLRLADLSLSLSNSDEDLAKFNEQRRETEQLVGEWKRSELLREAADAELASLKEQLRFVVLFSALLPRSPSSL